MAFNGSTYVYIPYVHPLCACVCVFVCLYLPLTPTRTKLPGWLKKKTPLLRLKIGKLHELYANSGQNVENPEKYPLLIRIHAFPFIFPTHTNKQTHEKLQRNETQQQQQQQQKSDHENASEKFAKINE